MAEHPNETLVRRGFTAFNTGDIPALSEIIADDAVQVSGGQVVRLTDISEDSAAEDEFLA